MARIYLIRHAPTADNEAGRYPDASDSPLSARGRRAARRLAHRLAEEPLTALVSSPRRRCVETAELLARGRGLSVTIDPALRELDFGAFGGLSFAEASARYPEESAAWAADPGHVAPPDGESFHALQERMAEWFRAGMATRGADEAIALIGHAGALKALLLYLLGIEPRRAWQIRLDPASLTVLDCYPAGDSPLYPGGAIVSLLNDCGHL